VADLIERGPVGVLRHRLVHLVGGDDLVDVLGPQLVLPLVVLELAAGVDEEHVGRLRARTMQFIEDFLAMAAEKGHRLDFPSLVSECNCHAALIPLTIPPLLPIIVGIG
jgi:hypothetical protein